MSYNPSVATLQISDGQARYLEPPHTTWLSAEEQYHGQHLPRTGIPSFKHRDAASLWYSEMNKLKRQVHKR